MMARFSTEGLDDIIKSMNDLGELAGSAADEMLIAGAEEVKKSWRKAANIHKHKLTGQMFDAIGFPKKPKSIGGIKTIDIHPVGNSTYTESPDGRRIKRLKPVRLAEIAFILHYGTSKHPGSHWIDTADKLSAEPVTRAMSDVWNKELRKKGLI